MMRACDGMHARSVRCRANGAQIAARARQQTRRDGTLLRVCSRRYALPQRSPSRRVAARRRSLASARGARAAAMSRRSAAQKRANALGVLGLAEGASDAEIKTAYKREALLHHPDKNGAPLPRSGCRVTPRSVRRRVRAVSERPRRFAPRRAPRAPEAAPARLARRRCRAARGAARGSRPRMTRTTHRALAAATAVTRRPRLTRPCPRCAAGSEESTIKFKEVSAAY